MIVALLLSLSVLHPIAQAGGCGKETRVIEGRALDVYVCEGLEVSLQAYVVSLSNCVPGMASCLGQIYYPLLAGEKVDYSYPKDGPIIFPSHLAYFPFSYCDPGFPIEVIRDPAMRDERGEEIRIPVRGYGFENPRSLAIGMTENQLPSPDCYVLRGLTLQEILAERERLEREIGNVVRFVVHDVSQVSGNAPVWRITAYYGYTLNYFDGYRFHEGLDTSWAGLGDDQLKRGAMAIWTPLPVMPVIVKPGWTLGMMPCGVADRIQSVLAPYPQGGYALREAFRELEERRTPPDRDCAVLFGGLHVYANAINSIPRRTADLMLSGMCAGRLPIECSLEMYVPAGGLMVPCAAEAGYAGAVAPHCHYQAVALSGDQARWLLGQLRSNPRVLISPPFDLDTKKTDWGGIGYVEWIYAKSFDPLILLYPDLVAGMDSDVAAGFRAWASHGIPSPVAPYSPPPELFVGWYQRATGEFYPGMPDYSSLGRAGIEPSTQGTECRVAGKEIPGWGCRPSGSYYNSPLLRGDRDAVFSSARLMNAVRAAVQVSVAVQSSLGGR